MKEAAAVLYISKFKFKLLAALVIDQTNYWSGREGVRMYCLKCYSQRQNLSYLHLVFNRHGRLVCLAFVTISSTRYNVVNRMSWWPLLSGLTRVEKRLSAQYGTAIYISTRSSG